MSVTMTSIVRSSPWRTNVSAPPEPDVEVGGVDEQVGGAGDHLAVDVLHGGVGAHRDGQAVEVGVEVADAQVEVVGAGGVGAAGERLHLRLVGDAARLGLGATEPSATNRSPNHHGVQRPKSKRSQPGGA